MRGVDSAGRVLVDRALPHGEHPETTLATAGYAALDILDAQSGPSPEVGSWGSAASTVTIVYLVAPQADACQARQESPRHGMARDRDLVLAPHEVPVPVQRLAAYAIVRAPAGLLLTALSERTNAAGLWSLPGGGVDPGETPEQALHREVFEETGQRIQLGGLLGVVDGHWVGRSPTGRVEDFHAVRLVYLADCPQPSPPVVHDVGGTTSAARWVGLAELAELPISGTWAALLADLVADWS